MYNNLNPLKLKSNLKSFLFYTGNAEYRVERSPFQETPFNGIFGMMMDSMVYRNLSRELEEHFDSLQKLLIGSYSVSVSLFPTNLYNGNDSSLVILSLKRFLYKSNGGYNHYSNDYKDIVIDIANDKLTGIRFPKTMYRLQEILHHFQRITEISYLMCTLALTASRGAVVANIPIYSNSNWKSI